MKKSEPLQVVFISHVVSLGLVFLVNYQGAWVAVTMHAHSKAFLVFYGTVFGC